MANLKITVVVPTYNRYKDLENLIKTFLLQDYQNSELLIIDDLGSSRIEEVTRKWMKKSKKITYYKNHKNLGVTTNIRNAFKISRSDVIVFMGDDDIFIDNKALSLFAKAFSDPNIGSAKASQILFKNGRVNQAYSLKRDKKQIIYYEKSDIFDKLWLESVSFTGLAFRNNEAIRKLISKSITLFPQVELMGFVSLFYKSAEINNYLVGAQSYSKGQLNPVFYDINDIRTNVLGDWLQIFERIRQLANKKKKVFISFEVFREKSAHFCLLLLPFNTLTNGRTQTAVFILNIFKYNKKIILVPFFWISLVVSTVLPKAFIIPCLEIAKTFRTKNQLNVKEIKKYNDVLKKYYLF
jgi:glycosyltransferase involved in cell wall biosynthesis